MSSSTIMESSRIFIKGLPPNLTEQDFKKHFSAKSQITDAKLIPHRRIGYVGFKTPEEAQKAVAYFNKSFIRMSKLAVEIARPISDPQLPTSRKVQREQARDARKIEVENNAKQAAEANNLKRKRTEGDEADSKLQEFLEVMQPASKSRNKPVGGMVDSEERPTKMQVMEMPEAESDDEYEAVPKKSTQSVSIEKTLAVESLPSLEIQTEAPAPVEVTEAAGDSAPVEAVDWLRSHTSRLLDIVDADELPTTTTAAEIRPIKAQPSSASAAPTSQDEQPAITSTSQDDPKDALPVLADETDATIEAIKLNGRLFIRNLPYTATESDVREHLSKYGALEEAHLCLDSAGVSKGFSFVQFESPDAAAEAFHNLDGEPFQGRLIQILPAATKRENKLDEFAIAKLPLKKQKEIKKKYEAGKQTFSWNSLYMNQDAINSSMASRLGISKTDLLDPTSSNAGVKQAIAETAIIQETKAYFKKNGVEIDAFKNKERGDTAILVKNFPFGTTMEEIRTMFEAHGQVIRVLMPPAGTIAIVEFAQAPQARAAYTGLAYRRMGTSMLFLEKAPKDIFKSAPAPAEALDNDPMVAATVVAGVEAKASAADLFETEADGAEAGADTCTLFVRNLNFSTTSDKLASLFRPLSGFLSAKVKTKTDPKKPGQVLSAGFGFLEFNSKAEANTALKAMNGYDLEGHKLLIKASHKGADAAEERRKEDRAKKINNKKTKIIIKNLPFEATKKDVYALFGNYGKLRSVRMPKKFGGATRGFAFAEFVSASEAGNALESLKSTHLLGRRLVIDFAEEEVLDPEEEIEKMRKKVSKQVDKTALHKLTAGGSQRKKFEIGNEDDE